MLVVRILVSFFVRVQYWHVHNRFIAFYHKGNQNRVCLTLTHIAESVIVPYIPLLLCSIFLKFKSASRKKRPQTIKALIFGGVGFKTSNVVPPPNFVVLEFGITLLHVHHQGKEISAAG